MTTQFTPSSRSNPCPICHNTSGKCKTVSGFAPRVLCGNDHASVGTKRFGWISTGRYNQGSASGLWRIWREDDGRDYSTPIDPAITAKREAARKAYAAQRQYEEQQNLHEIRDRDYRGYTTLFDSLGLKEDHRQDLHRRGLSDDAITRYGFKSIRYGDHVPGGLKLSGVEGARWVGGSGMLIPHRDYRGNIIGVQVKTDGDTSGKYIWTNLPHVLRGDSKELPLAVNEPGKDQVVFCEGGLKSAIAADQHAVTTVGAAGGSFAGSPKQLEEILTGLGVRHVYFAPDAGGVTNKQVFNRDLRTIETLEALGATVSVLYWGQGFDKSMGDIDEIDNLSELAETISPAAYRELATGKTALAQILEPISKVPETRDLKAMAKRLVAEINQPDPIKLARTTTAITLWDAKHARQYSQDYIPGQLPSFEDWRAMGSPNFEYQPGQRKTFWAEALKKGFKHILDSSEVGSGKSHDAGELAHLHRAGISLDEDGGRKVGRLIYLSRDHNPATESIQRYFWDAPARHNGLMIEKTSLGVRQRRLTAAEKAAGITPNVAPNCEYADVFNEARSRGYEIPGGIKSPACQSCPHFHGCQVDGFLAEQQQATKFSTLRGHPDQFQKARKDDVILWEETGQIFRVQQQREITTDEVARTMQDLQVLHPDLFQLLRPIAANLYRTIREESKSRYGVDHKKLAKSLDTKESIFNNIWEHQSDTWLTTQDVWDLPSTQQVIDLVVGAAESDAEKWSVLAENQTPADRLAAIESLTPIWVKPVMASMTGGDDRVNLHKGRNGLTLTTDFANHRRLAHSAAANIYLDATLTATDLARIIRVSQWDILTTKSKPQDFSNLTIKVLEGMGRISTQRGAHLARIRAVVAAIQSETNAPIGVIDYKRYLEEYSSETTAGAWMRDNRGSNSFKGLDHLIIVGTAIPNLTAMASEWHTLTGRAVTPNKLTGSYGEWIARKSLDELIQAIGRLRAQHTDKPKTVYLLGDNEQNLAAIADYFKSSKIIRQDAGVYSPDALTKGHNRLRAIAQATRDLAELGQAQLKNVAGRVGCAMSNITQTLQRKIGLGFKKFKAIISEIISGAFDDSDLLDNDNLTPDQLEAITALETWLSSCLIYCAPDEVWRELQSLKDTLQDAIWVGLWKWIKPTVSLSLVTTMLKL